MLLTECSLLKGYWVICVWDLYLALADLELSHVRFALSMYFLVIFICAAQCILLMIFAVILLSYVHYALNRWLCINCLYVWICECLILRTSEFAFVCFLLPCCGPYLIILCATASMHLAAAQHDDHLPVFVANAQAGSMTVLSVHCLPTCQCASV